LGQDKTLPATAAGGKLSLQLGISLLSFCSILLSSLFCTDEKYI